MREAMTTADKLVEALRRISQQKTCNELTEEELYNADWQVGYDALIEIAREILTEYEREKAGQAVKPELKCYEIARQVIKSREQP